MKFLAIAPIHESLGVSGVILKNRKLLERGLDGLRAGTVDKSLKPLIFTRPLLPVKGQQLFDRSRNLAGRNFEYIFSEHGLSLGRGTAQHHLIMRNDMSLDIS